MSLQANGVPQPPQPPRVGRRLRFHATQVVGVPLIALIPILALLHVFGTTLADLLDVDGANPFRVRAYRKAARSVEGHDEPVEEMVRRGEDVQRLAGVGKDIGALIREFVEHGRTQALEEIRSEVPASLVEVTNVQGIGPKRARTLHRELGVGTLNELEAAAREGRIAWLTGFGEKTQGRILAGIAAARRFGRRMRRVDAVARVAPFLEHLRGHEGLERLEVAGS